MSKLGRVTTLGGLRIFTGDSLVTSLPNQPVRCALLLFLAVEGEGTRDTIVGNLWPERDPSLARHSLNQTVYSIRQMLADGWITGTGARLAIGHDVDVDTQVFEQAMRESRWNDALQLYRGEFLQGTYLIESKEFEFWVDGHRSRYRRMHRKARREALSKAKAEGDGAQGMTIAREWAELEPFDDEAQLRFVELLAELGHRTEALHQYEMYQKLLASEDGQLQPLDELQTLIRRIRNGEADRALPSRVTQPRHEPAPARATAPSALPVPSQTSTEIERPVNSVAVLPFVNLSPEPESEYFSDGITEELINLLADLGSVQVAARTSSFAFKNNPLDVREIGKRLNVRFVVEGSVRKAGERIRVSSRLVSTNDGYPFWSGRYDGRIDDIFRIQEESAGAIAEALSLHISDAPRVKRQTDKTEAYRLYLLGRYHWNRRTPDAMEVAVRSFQDAIAVDPGYAPAYGGLADAYVGQAQFGYANPRDVLPLADTAIQYGLQVDHTLPELWATHAHVLEVYHWDFERSDRAYRQAIALNPRDGNTRAWYGAMLSALGRFTDALHHTRVGLQLEPFSLPTRFHHGMLLYRSRHYDDALIELRATAEMNPAYFAAPVFATLVYTAAGRPAEGLAQAQEALARFGPHPAVLTVLGHALGTLGEHQRARSILAQLDQVAAKFYVPAVFRAMVLGSIGDLDAAFDSLDRALDERYGQVMFINVDPVYDSLRSDSRLQKLIAQLKLE